MNFNLPDIHLLRNNIDFCSIAQFFHTFADVFAPWPATPQDIIYARHAEPNNEYVFETEDLERMLLETSERIRLEDLFVRMLRLVTRNRFINSSNWQSYYSKEFDKREYEQLNPLIKPLEQKPEEQLPPAEGADPVPAAEPEIKKPEPINYFTLDLETRVYLLHLLCEWQLDEPERFREHLSTEEDAVTWRVDPIGFDKRGGTFWLFDDNRLYVETPKPKPVKKSAARNKKKKRATPSRSTRRSARGSAAQEEPEEEIVEAEPEEETEWVPWKLLCYTKYEWENLPSKYADSKNIDEQRFHRLLVEDLLPKVLPVLNEHEERIKKQAAILHRKRSSRIMIKELEALERGSAVDPVVEDPYAPSTGGRTRSNRIEHQIAEKEQQEKEALAKAREERLLERERRIMEREYRALKRQASEDVVPETVNAENGPIVIDGTSPLPAKKPKTTKKKAAATYTTAAIGENGEPKPKRKYVKKPKFDENGNPIPRKVKLDKDGNPIPLKKRGRKPKNKDDDNWLFDCVCGVSGENIDDGTPLVACEKCGTWQHIGCLVKAGQIPKTDSIASVKFICQKCERFQEEQEHERRRQREQYYNSIASAHAPTGSYSQQMPAMQNSWPVRPTHPIQIAQQKYQQYQQQQQQQQQQQPLPVRPSQPGQVAQQQQMYRPPNTSVLPPIRSFSPNQAPSPQQQPSLPFYNHSQPPQQQQERPMVAQNYSPQQQGHYPAIAMNPSPQQQQQQRPQQQPILNPLQTYPQATVSQQQTIQSIVSQVASNPQSLAQLASLLDKNLQQQQQQQQQQKRQ